MARPSNIRQISDHYTRTFYINTDKILKYQMDASNSQVLVWLQGIPEAWGINVKLAEFEDAMFGTKETTDAEHF